jgi:hypothetical protein
VARAAAPVRLSGRVEDQLSSAGSRTIPIVRFGSGAGIPAPGQLHRRHSREGERDDRHRNAHPAPTPGPVGCAEQACRREQQPAHDRKKVLLHVDGPSALGHVESPFPVRSFVGSRSGPAASVCRGHVERNRAPRAHAMNPWSAVSGARPCNHLVGVKDQLIIRLIVFASVGGLIGLLDLCVSRVRRWWRRPARRDRRAPRRGPGRATLTGRPSSVSSDAGRFTGEAEPRERLEDLRRRH